nr:protein PIGBOS1 [Nerophis lumbriciformis]
MFRRNIPFTQMAFAALLGVAGGFYIYRPLFHETGQKTTTQPNQDVILKEDSSAGKKSSS